jgi:hypothetical protein
MSGKRELCPWIGNFPHFSQFFADFGWFFYLIGDLLERVGRGNHFFGWKGRGVPLFWPKSHYVYTVKPIYGTIQVKYSETYFTDYHQGITRVFGRFPSRGLARYIPGFWPTVFTYCKQFSPFFAIFCGFWLIFLLNRRSSRKGREGVITFLAERVGGCLYSDLSPTMSTL